MIKILVKDYKTRAELEAFIVKTYGQTTDAKTDIISGSRIDMESLGLSESTKIWGLSCEIIGNVKNIQKPQRGVLGAKKKK